MSGKGTASLSFLRTYAITATLVLSLMAALLLVLAGVSDGPNIRMSRLAMPLFVPQDVQLVSATDEQPGGASCPGFAEMEQSVKTGVADAVVKEIAPAAYMPLFNALPPATQLSVPQRLLTAESPSLPTVLLLGFGADGCQIMRATIPKEQHHDLLKKMEASI